MEDVKEENPDRERDEAYIERTSSIDVKELIEMIKPLIQKNGLRIDGIGILPGKLDQMIALQDRTNFLLAKLLESVNR